MAKCEIGFFNSSRVIAMVRDNMRERISRLVHSFQSLAPYDCAVNPLHPMRKNAQFQ